MGGRLRLPMLATEIPDGALEGVMDGAHTTFEDVKRTAGIERYAEDHLTASGRPGWYVCPRCHSGERPGGTAAFHLWGNGGKFERFKCFSCSASGDVYDLAGIVCGTEDKGEQLRAVAEWAGVPVAELPAAKDARAPQRPRKLTAEQQAEQLKAEGYVERSRAAMAEGCEGWRYLVGRGVTPEQIEAHGIGWDAAGRRVVIPWGNGYYVARDVTGEAERKYLKPSFPQPVYNPHAIAEPVVFVVEGVMDALAVEAAGFAAVALMSNRSRDVEALFREAAYGGMVGVMLDADEAGRRGAEEFADAMAKAGVRYAPVAQLDGCKDAGEAVEAGRASELAEHLRGFVAGFDAAERAERDARYDRVLAGAGIVDACETVMDIYQLKDERRPVPTGIRGIDAALGGGLPVGVTTLGAVSSMGKTSLLVQMADAIAASGRSVLFVTVEQTARELVAKSLSRIMAAAEHPLAVSGAEVCSGAARRAWRDGEYGTLAAACGSYARDIAPRLRYMEPDGQPGVEDVMAAAQAIAEHDGEPPVVFIDYLQLLKASGPRLTDKQATDENVMALRQMAGRKLKTPVVLVSSLNRSSYGGVVSLDSFKESGAIEYGSDVLLGLQPAGMEAELEGVPEAKVARTAKRKVRDTKAGREWDVELVVLKNRGGRTYERGVPLTFTPRTSTFKDGPVRTGTIVI